jgi:hypothetical protein
MNSMRSKKDSSKVLNSKLVNLQRKEPRVDIGPENHGKAKTRPIDQPVRDDGWTVVVSKNRRRHHLNGICRGVAWKDSKQRG